MKKIIFISSLLVAILAGCSCSQPSAGDDLFSGSFQDLLGKGKNVKCEIQVKDGSDGVVSGVTYVAGEKARSEFEVTIPGEGTMKNFMIADKEWMYSWNDKYPEYAMKMKLSDLESEDFADADEQPGADNLDSIKEDFDYKCSKWSPDNSMFTPPTGVEFVDFTETLKGLQDSFGDGSVPGMGDTSDLCGTCNMIPDASGKAECLESLGCN